MGRKKELKPLERTELERIELAHGQSIAAALAAMTGDAAYVVAPDGKRVAILVRPAALHALSVALMMDDLLYGCDADIAAMEDEPNADNAPASRS